MELIVTDTNTVDCIQAQALIGDLRGAQYLMADKAYDTNALLEWCENNNTWPVIPPHKPAQSPARL